jgi:hypothetical protein
MRDLIIRLLQFMVNPEIEVDPRLALAYAPFDARDNGSDPAAKLTAEDVRGAQAQAPSEKSEAGK